MKIQLSFVSLFGLFSGRQLTNITTIKSMGKYSDQNPHSLLLQLLTTHIFPGLFCLFWPIFTFSTYFPYFWLIYLPKNFNIPQSLEALESVGGGGLSAQVCTQCKAAHRPCETEGRAGAAWQPRGEGPMNVQEGTMKLNHQEPSLCWMMCPVAGQGPTRRADTKEWREGQAYQPRCVGNPGGMRGA